MNILVINGSPKGQNSITLQTTNYLKILHPEHEFSVLDAGQKIKALEKDFSKAIEEIKKANLLVFSYPVYTFIAPCQLHRFIELLKEANLDLNGKFVTQFTTSKHFYDITAHRYIKDNCFDLGLKYINGLSADMDDLSTEQGQKQAEEFFDYVSQHLSLGLTAEEKKLSVEMEQSIDSTKKQLKKLARHRIEDGKDVKTELHYIDIVRHVEKAGDCVYSIVNSL